MGKIPKFGHTSFCEVGKKSLNIYEPFWVPCMKQKMLSITLELSLDSRLKVVVFLLNLKIASGWFTSFQINVGTATGSFLGK